MTTILGGGLERTLGRRQDRRTLGRSQDTSCRENIFTCTGRLGAVRQDILSFTFVTLSLSPGNRVYPVLRHIQVRGRRRMFSDFLFTYWVMSFQTMELAIGSMMNEIF